MDSFAHYVTITTILLLSLSLSPTAVGNDASSLLALKSAFDPHNTSNLNWPTTAAATTTTVCKWEGVKACLRGRVSKLVIENLNLTTGTLLPIPLNSLDQLRVLSFKANNLTGPIPDMSGLANLKTLYLNENSFTGEFPVSLLKLHRLKTVVLAGNHLTGRIPAELAASVPRLYALYLEDNGFEGEVPALDQPDLTFLNLSGNRLAGKVPDTAVLRRFNASSFGGNVGLCGVQVGVECGNAGEGTGVGEAPAEREGGGGGGKKRRRKIIVIAVSAAAGAVVVLLVGLLLCVGVVKRRRTEKVTEGGREKKDRETEAAGTAGAASSAARGVREKGEGSGYGGGAFSWEGDGLGKLVFVGVESGDNNSISSTGGGAAAGAVRYSLEELLKASAETLGKGSVGSTYKAVMESGYIVTVKRLKDARHPRVEEFRRHMVEVLGRMRHPNLVPVRAYFQAKEERLLVYDYFPNGSLYSLIHGSRPSSGGAGGGKPLHWTSCLKIAEDVATGLHYIHTNFNIPHGNIKSSNVLLGSDFESCLTDYALHPFRNPDFSESEPLSATSLFYRAPECRHDHHHPRNLASLYTQQGDVYSFGVLLLELLTGKTPFMDLVQEHGADIPKWVRSVRDEETTDQSGGEDPSSAGSGNENSAGAGVAVMSSEEKLGALLNIAMACIVTAPEERPHVRDVVRMIREARAEGGSGAGAGVNGNNNNASSNNSSSGHSPGRWSDTVQSLPREDEHQSI